MIRAYFIGGSRDLSKQALDMSVRSPLPEIFFEKHIRFEPGEGGMSEAARPGRERYILHGSCSVVSMNDTFIYCYAGDVK